MAEVLGGIGETIDTTKFNGISNTKDETVPIKHEEVELSQHVTTSLPAQAYLGTQLSVQINAGTQLSVQDSAGIQSSVQSNAGMQLLVQDNTGSQQQIKVKSHKKTEEEDEEEEEENTAAEQEDSSPSDYEFSLREENIRLKSRLEQAKEGMSTLEKQCKKIKEELEKEKKFGDKANSTIYSLMQEKQSLIEKMKRSQPLNSAHTEGIQEVVRKLEHEIQVLEERLDSQRKRYHQEHVLMYEDLKEERIKRQEWKQTYLKSQVAVMAFRRKLTLMKDRVSEEDIKELSKCLELVFHEQDGHLKQDLITQKEEGCVEGNSKYATHISKLYRNSKEIPKVTETVDANLTLQLPSKRVTDLKDVGSAVTAPPQIMSHKHPMADNERDDPTTPKVFIMDEDELIDPTTTKPSGDDINVKLPPMSNTNPRMFSNSNQRYELDGSKHHQSYNQSGHQRHSHDRPPQYKHWHHYSVDNPGHNPGQNRKLDVLGSTDRIPDGDIGNKKSLVNTLQRIEDRSYKSKFSKYGFNDQLELNVNDTKFLELNFDQAFLKGTAPSKLPKSLQQKNGIRNEGPEKKSEEGKKLYCVTCDKEVPNRLCGHANIIVQEREREFPCPTCARVFTNRSHLKRHNMIHSGEKPFACTYCDKRFNRKSHLSRHLLTHTGEKPFKCPTCDKGFADNSDLKRHRQIHEVTPNLVPILPKENTTTVQPTQIQPNPIALTAITSIPSTANAILTTIASVSTDQKPTTFIMKKKDVRYPCNKCGKTFSRKSHLTRHRLTHDKVKIYCDCGRLFRQNAHLQAHLPACIRKREAIEAKYLAECQLITQSGDLPPDAVKVEESLADASGQSLADGLIPKNLIQSVDDFKARLNAKFNDGGNLNEIKSREEEISKLQSLQEKKVKEEALDESSIEIDQGGMTARPDSTDEGKPSSEGNLENKNMEEVSSNENTSTNVNDDNEKLFLVTRIPTDVVSNEFLNDNDTEEKTSATKIEQNTTEQNSHEDTSPEQKMSDINFNLIVKNGSTKLPNDDLALGVDSIPCLPIEIPPLLNE